MGKMLSLCCWQYKCEHCDEEVIVDLSKTLSGFIFFEKQFEVSENSIVPIESIYGHIKRLEEDSVVEAHIYNPENPEEILWSNMVLIEKNISEVFLREGTVLCKFSGRLCAGDNI